MRHVEYHKGLDVEHKFQGCKRLGHEWLGARWEKSRGGGCVEGVGSGQRQMICGTQGGNCFWTVPIPISADDRTNVPRTRRDMYKP